MWGALAVSALAAAPAWAEEDGHHHHEEHGEHREMGAHQHGVAELGIAADGNKLVIEFESPAANIVGFEHAPKNAEQEKALEIATAVLKDQKGQFVFDAAAGCTMASVQVTPPHSDSAEADHEGHAEHGKHEEHEEHEQHEEHGDGDHADIHSEFSAAYNYDCAAIGQLRTIQVQLFEAFPGIEKIEAVFLAEDLQFGADLTKTENALKLP